MNEFKLWQRILNMLQVLVVVASLLGLVISVTRWYVSTVKLPPGYYIETNGQLYKTYTESGRLLAIHKSKFDAIHAAISEENLRVLYNTNWVRLAP